MDDLFEIRRHKTLMEINARCREDGPLNLGSIGAWWKEAREEGMNPHDTTYVATNSPYMLGWLMVMFVRYGTVPYVLLDELWVNFGQETANVFMDEMFRECQKKSKEVKGGGLPMQEDDEFDKFVTWAGWGTWEASKSHILKS